MANYIQAIVDAIRKHRQESRLSNIPRLGTIANEGTAFQAQQEALTATGGQNAWAVTVMDPVEFAAKVEHLARYLADKNARDMETAAQSLENPSAATSQPAKQSAPMPADLQAQYQTRDAVLTDALINAGAKTPQPSDMEDDFAM